MKGLFLTAAAAFEMLGSLIKTFRRQRISPAILLAFVLLGLALFFAFLSFAPILSPFVYPLF